MATSRTRRRSSRSGSLSDRLRELLEEEDRGSSRSNGRRRSRSSEDRVLVIEGRRAGRLIETLFGADGDGDDDEEDDDDQDDDDQDDDDAGSGDDDTRPKGKVPWLFR